MSTTKPSKKWTTERVSALAALPSLTGVGGEQYKAAGVGLMRKVAALSRDDYQPGDMTLCLFKDADARVQLTVINRLWLEEFPGSMEKAAIMSWICYMYAAKHRELQRANGLRWVLRSHAQFAEQLQISERSVKRHLKALEEAGYISSCVKMRGLTRMYHVRPSLVKVMATRVRSRRATDLDRTIAETYVRRVTGDAFEEVMGLARHQVKDAECVFDAVARLAKDADVLPDVDITRGLVDPDLAAREKAAAESILKRGFKRALKAARGKAVKTAPTTASEESCDKNKDGLFTHRRESHDALYAAARHIYEHGEYAGADVEEFKETADRLGALVEEGPEPSKNLNRTFLAECDAAAADLRKAMPAGVRAIQDSHGYEELRTEMLEFPDSGDEVRIRKCGIFRSEAKAAFAIVEKTRAEQKPSEQEAGNPAEWIAEFVRRCNAKAEEVFGGFNRRQANCGFLVVPAYNDPAEFTVMTPNEDVLARNEFMFSPIPRYTVRVDVACGEFSLHEDTGAPVTWLPPLPDMTTPKTIPHVKK